MICNVKNATKNASDLRVFFKAGKKQKNNWGLWEEKPHKLPETTPPLQHAAFGGNATDLKKVRENPTKKKKAMCVLRFIFPIDFRVKYGALNWTS